MVNYRLSLSRLNEILRRQDPPRFGSEYVPAILAERTEAPAHSRPRRVWSPKLNRECHLLSSVEERAFRLALYNPDVFEVHEQRMLAMEARPHPLVGHPLGVGQLLPSLEGTIAVAERLDFLHLHPRLHVRGQDGAPVSAPFPWIGDLLLFVMDDQGPYCVNWTIKGSSEGFNRSFPKARPAKDPEKDRGEAKARHAIEEIYYRDAGIRTVRVVESDIPDTLDANLRRLYLAFGVTAELDTEIRARLLDRLQACLLTGRPPMEVFLSMRSQYDVNVLALKAYMEQAIWRRELRVDLFGAPIFADQPLVPEKTDVLTKYAHWFAREAS